MSRSLYARLHHRYGTRVDGATRRDFLKASLAAAGALMLPSSLWGQAPKGGSRAIVVVGGGFAGLACARELLLAGHDVTVVEARNRVGGRVLSTNEFIPGRNVELGGELIGSNHPMWVGYAKEFGLEFLDLTEEDGAAPIFIGGHRLSDEEAEGLWESMDATFNLMNAEAVPVNADRPWLSPNAEALDRMSLADWIAKLEIPEKDKAVALLQLEGDNGVAPQLQSFLGMLSQVAGGGGEAYWTESEVYRCSGGNQQLAHKLEEALGPNRIVKGLAVTAIKSDRDKVVVTCADRRTLECDEVVLAVPPTVWKKINISPAIPAALKPQMGTNIKHFTALKGPFWRDGGLAPDCLTDGDISMSWHGTDNQPEDAGVCLVAFSGGPAADRARARRGAERDAYYKAELEKIFPGYSESATATRFMDWPADPWLEGGYSFPAPGQVTTMGPLLEKGMGRVHFAGEHACYKFVGYMEGALQSGAAAARRIMEKYGAPAATPAPTPAPTPAATPAAAPAATPAEEPAAVGSGS